jgi:flagellar protein FliO/FliZ
MARPGLGDMFFADTLLEIKILYAVIAAFILVIAAGAGFMAMRRNRQSRIRAPGASRTGLPRLSIVEAFDLDRQRQLVIVRRDNVEHLIMVGGPNDLVIEAEITRSERRQIPASEAEKGLDKEAPSPDFDLPQRVPVTGFGPLREPPAKPEAPGPGTAAAFDEAGRPAAHKGPPFPFPPRRLATPVAPSSPRSPQHREPPLTRARPTRETPSLPPEGGISRTSANLFGRPLPSRDEPGLTTPPPEPSSEELPEARAPARPEDARTGGPSPTAEKPEGIPPASTGPAPEEGAKGADDLPHDAIDKLEAEMAELLGRRPIP